MSDLPYMVNMMESRSSPKSSLSCCRENGRFLNNRRPGEGETLNIALVYFKLGLKGHSELPRWVIGTRGHSVNFEFGEAPSKP